MLDDLMDDMLDDFCHGFSQHFSTIFIRSDIPTIFQVLDGFQRSMSCLCLILPET